MSLGFAAFFELAGIMIAVGSIVDTVKIIKYFGKGLRHLLQNEYGPQKDPEKVLESSDFSEDLIQIQEIKEKRLDETSVD